MTSMRRRHAVPGQALIEFAIGLPVLLLLIFGIFTFMSAFAKQSAATQSAQTLAEWISRTGTYDAPKRLATLEQLNSTPLAGSEGVFLHIVVTEPYDPANGLAYTGAALEIGEAPGTGGVAPADTGWDHIDEVNAATGAVIAVSVWSYLTIDIPFLGSTTLVTPSGHAVSYTIRGGS